MEGKEKYKTGGALVFTALAIVPTVAAVYKRDEIPHTVETIQVPFNMSVTVSGISSTLSVQ